MSSNDHVLGKKLQEQFEPHPDPKVLTGHKDPSGNITGIDYEPYPENSVKVSPDKEDIMKRITNLYSGSASEQDMQVYAKESIYDDPFSYCDTRYKIAGQWYGKYFRICLETISSRRGSLRKGCHHGERFSATKSLHGEVISTARVTPQRSHSLERSPPRRSSFHGESLSTARISPRRESLHGESLYGESLGKNFEGICSRMVALELSPFESPHHV